MNTLLLYWITGVLEAGRKGMDIVGASAIGLVCAAGGGTLRDLLLGRKVFWIADQTYLLVALLAAVMVYLLVRNVRLPPRLFLIPDAIGLALFSVSGTLIALHSGAPWLVAALMGVITGVLGGVLRDILCNDIPLIFLPGELYAVAATGGSLTVVILKALEFSQPVAACSGFVIALGLRAAGMFLQWRAPHWKPRE
ncbi:MAG: hypothetical protein BSR46_13775 [Candidatus Dactylopiibacterium carminicum]|uniref:trimeric intracellular cation channel family protein n=1 Tax=Candidatus Dactylopiibacterium carminicum TaxID=857335 RepID=UPI000BC96FDD|nr:trimeric intracellular cation channel family protein [Candidatus Dactylopiibacterium carminicum]PAS97410.1 MAG: hypothetical protein BSR46_13775 [Candidatus Dactylopiibacterium carminicum]